jgi:hypothetical protein
MYSNNMAAASDEIVLIRIRSQDLRFGVQYATTELPRIVTG